MTARREQLVVVGLNHRTAPIEVRERFALGGECLAAWVDRLATRSGISECVVLSTCNRTECYAAGPDADAIRSVVAAELCAAAGVGPAGAGFLRAQTGLDAVLHLFRVTGGLDSLVIGEPQIQGQVSSAYHRGEARVLGPVLHRLFQSALAAGKRVRATTSIARGATSIPSAAVSLARKVFGGLEDRTVLVLGTGKMGRLTVSCLRSEGLRRVYVASRNPARAERVGRALDGVPTERAEALERLGEMDVVIACTEAEAAFLRRPHVAGRREGSPLVILDIAVPRNVAPAVGEVAEVFLYNIDDLQRVVDQTHEARTIERERAEAIVRRHARKAWDWQRTRVAVPSIRALRGVAHGLAQRALDEALAGPRDADEEEGMRLAVRAALNKILHGPTRAMRRLARRPDAEEVFERLAPLLAPPPERASSAGTAGRRSG